MKKKSKKNDKKRFFFFILILLFCTGLLFLKESPSKNVEKTSLWEFRSIDTMKYSRDLSREKLNDPSFDNDIDQQIKNIAATGASHVAIATPYDEEFMPILTRWVKAARQYHLHVWFRGNWSGWEEWFDYPKISRQEHIQKTENFILEHSSLFQDGDIFSACPECENGGPGDPRFNGDIYGHRQFLIGEYSVTKAAFQKIRKKVASNYDSMNGDVARLIMDQQTTEALDGIVVIDHYVGTAQQLQEDIKDFASQSGGKIVLGEFGAPIPDIHGDMTEQQQAEWLRDVLQALRQTKELVGLNYWTNVGGSTELWKDDGTPRKAVQEITKLYTSKVIKPNFSN